MIIKPFNFKKGYHPKTIKQYGAALVTSLIFIVLLTLISFTVFNSAVMQGRMAGNLRDRQIAYGATEIALRDAEDYIRNSGRICGGTEADSNNDEQKLCKNGMCYNDRDMRGGQGTAATGNDDWLSTPIWKQSAKWAKAIPYYKALGRKKYNSSETPLDNSGNIPANPITYRDITNCPNWYIAQATDTNAYAEPTSAIPIVNTQPSYLIEYFSKNIDGECYYYRITARGYGARSTTEVTLQTVFTPMNCQKSAQQ